MSSKITWEQPNRPEIPSGWFIIINGNIGTAYQNAEDYISDLNIILEEQASNVNEPPIEE